MDVMEVVRVSCVDTFGLWSAQLSPRWQEGLEVPGVGRCLREKLIDSSAVVTLSLGGLMRRMWEEEHGGNQEHRCVVGIPLPHF